MVYYRYNEALMKEREVEKMKVVVVSHGSFSKGLVESVQMLAGEQENLIAYGLFPEETVNTLTEKLEKEILATPKGEDILFLTDLFHGSPFNAVVSLMKNYKFSHITGINLPLMLEIILSRHTDKSLEEICNEVVKTAGETVKDVNRLLEENQEDEEE